MAMRGSKEWYDDMDKVVKKYTGWSSLQKMCLNCPTLRWAKGMKPAEKEAIVKMRDAYEYISGKPAYPEIWKK